MRQKRKFSCDTTSSKQGQQTSTCNKREEVEDTNPAEGFFRGINRRIDPNKTMSEEAMRVIIDQMVATHVAGTVLHTKGVRLKSTAPKRELLNGLTAIEPNHCD